MNLTNNNVEQKRPNTKEYVVYVSIYISTKTSKTNLWVISEANSNCWREIVTMGTRRTSGVRAIWLVAWVCVGDTYLYFSIH